MVRAPLITPDRYGESRGAALSMIKALDRELKRMELPSKPPESVAPAYRREILDRLEKMRDRAGETRARIRDGASPGPAIRRLLRAHDNFWDAYFEATYTLRFDQCLEEQAALARMANTFKRRARRECGSASRAIATATDRQNLEGFREAHSRERSLLRKLAKLRPAPRQRLQFRRAMAAGRAVEKELAKVLARYGTLTASEAQSYEKRLTRLSRRARIAFAALGLNACGRAF